MSLASALTVERLHDLADWGYERGVRYFEQGRVASFKVEDDILEGLVIGGEEYRARLFLRGRGLGYDCTCPVGGRGQACKHVVALGLALLAGVQPAPLAKGPVFATRAQVEAFVR